MGSLASRPKVPAVQTVYMPVYTPPPTTSGSIPLPTGQEATVSPPATPSESAQVADRREAGLLERKRGVVSTVLTGFRGLLDRTSTPQRKSLLGE